MLANPLNANDNSVSNLFPNIFALGITIYT
jgi:hypothetical protein